MTKEIPVAYNAQPTTDNNFTRITLANGRTVEWSVQVDASNNMFKGLTIKYAEGKEATLDVPIGLTSPKIKLSGSSTGIDPDQFRRDAAEIIGNKTIQNQAEQVYGRSVKEEMDILADIVDKASVKNTPADVLERLEGLSTRPTCKAGLRECGVPISPPTPKQ